MTSEAENYAVKVVELNYSDDQGIDLDERVNEPVRYRDIVRWLAQGYEAGKAATTTPNSDECDECGEKSPTHSRTCSLHADNIVG